MIPCAAAIDSGLATSRATGIRPGSLSLKRSTFRTPAKTRQPHDVIVDSKGMAWYADFGDTILGKMDPANGKVTE